jgi:hypothetical protein
MRRAVFYGLAELLLVLLLHAPALSDDSPKGRMPDGDGSAEVTGERKQWHKVTLTLRGPYADERDQQPNPFVDYRLTVTFEHASGTPRYRVPGYFAADGRAGETGASSGVCWRAHLSPDKPGEWTWRVSFVQGERVAINENAPGAPTAAIDGKSGVFSIAPTDKSGRDFRAKGRLQYVGKHHLQFAGSREFFLKAGPDAPETLLAYEDFDGTVAGPRREPRPGEAVSARGLHRYQPHLRDWKDGDPTWRNGKGKGLIGALNYLASKGCNAFSFLTYNAGGDGDNVWPFIARNAKLHYDCSKLDQWGVVFDHATHQGLYLHFKMQENEMDDNRRGHEKTSSEIPEALDGGQLGIERKLYCRELIARFGHALALNWNLGEENTQSAEEQLAMIDYLRQTDPYQHLIVVHTFPNEQDQVYSKLLGEKSHLTGVSLQNSWRIAHQQTLKWVRESNRAGRHWVVANDEQGPASLGVPPDPGYEGFDGIARVRTFAKDASDAKNQPPSPSSEETRGYTLHDIRKYCLWGTLMAGGAGVEYYFGYQLPQNDLVCEDFRSRDQSWDYCRIALEFFQREDIPFERMTCSDELVGNERNDNSRYCLALSGELCVIYLPNGGTTELNMKGVPAKKMSVRWYNPRSGGELQHGAVTEVAAPGKVSLGPPPAEVEDDWLIVVRAQERLP